MQASNRFYREIIKVISGNETDSGAYLNLGDFLDSVYSKLNTSNKRTSSTYNDSFKEKFITNDDLISEADFIIGLRNIGFEDKNMSKYLLDCILSGRKSSDRNIDFDAYMRIYDIAHARVQFRSLRTVLLSQASSLSQVLYQIVLVGELLPAEQIKNLHKLRISDLLRIEVSEEDLRYTLESIVPLSIMEKFENVLDITARVLSTHTTHFRLPIGKEARLASMGISSNTVGGRKAREEADKALSGYKIKLAYFMAALVAIIPRQADAWRRQGNRLVNEIGEAIVWKRLEASSQDLVNSSSQTTDDNNEGGRKLMALRNECLDCETVDHIIDVMKGWRVILDDKAVPAVRAELTEWLGKDVDPTQIGRAFETILAEFCAEDAWVLGYEDSEFIEHEEQDEYAHKKQKDQNADNLGWEVQGKKPSSRKSRWDPEVPPNLKFQSTDQSPQSSAVSASKKAFVEACHAICKPLRQIIASHISDPTSIKNLPIPSAILTPTHLSPRESHNNMTDEENDNPERMKPGERITKSPLKDKSANLSPLAAAAAQLERPSTPRRRRVQPALSEIDIDRIKNLRNEEISGSMFEEVAGRLFGDVTGLKLDKISLEDKKRHGNQFRDDILVLKRIRLSDIEVAFNGVHDVPLQYVMRLFMCSSAIMLCEAFLPSFVSFPAAFKPFELDSNCSRRLMESLTKGLPIEFLLQMLLEPTLASSPDGSESSTTQLVISQIISSVKKDRDALMSSLGPLCAVIDRSTTSCSNSDISRRVLSMKKNGKISIDGFEAQHYVGKDLQNGFAAGVKTSLEKLAMSSTEISKLSYTDFFSICAKKFSESTFTSLFALEYVFQKWNLDSIRSKAFSTRTISDMSTSKTQTANKLEPLSTKMKTTDEDEEESAFLLQALNTGISNKEKQENTDDDDINTEEEKNKAFFDIDSNAYIHLESIAAKKAGNLHPVILAAQKLFQLVDSTLADIAFKQLSKSKPSSVKTAQPPFLIRQGLLSPFNIIPCLIIGLADLYRLSMYSPKCAPPPAPPPSLEIPQPRDAYLQRRELEALSDLREAIFLKFDAVDRGLRHIACSNSSTDPNSEDCAPIMSQPLPFEVFYSRFQSELGTLLPNSFSRNVAETIFYALDTDKDGLLCFNRLLSFFPELLLLRGDANRFDRIRESLKSLGPMGLSTAHAIEVIFTKFLNSQPSKFHQHHGSKEYNFNTLSLENNVNNQISLIPSHHTSAGIYTPNITHPLHQSHFSSKNVEEAMMPFCPDPIEDARRLFLASDSAFQGEVRALQVAAQLRYPVYPSHVAVLATARSALVLRQVVEDLIRMHGSIDEAFMGIVDKWWGVGRDSVIQKQKDLLVESVRGHLRITGNVNLDSDELGEENELILVSPPVVRILMDGMSVIGNHFNALSDEILKISSESTNIEKHILDLYSQAVPSPPENINQGSLMDNFLLDMKKLSSAICNETSGNLFPILRRALACTMNLSSYLDNLMQTVDSLSSGAARLVRDLEASLLQLEAGYPGSDLPFTSTSLAIRDLSSTAAVNRLGSKASEVNVETMDIHADKCRAVSTKLDSSRIMLAKLQSIQAELSAISTSISLELRNGPFVLKSALALPGLPKLLQATSTIDNQLEVLIAIPSTFGTGNSIPASLMNSRASDTIELHSRLIYRLSDFRMTLQAVSNELKKYLTPIRNDMMPLITEFVSIAKEFNDLGVNASENLDSTLGLPSGTFSSHILAQTKRRSQLTGPSAEVFDPIFTSASFGSLLTYPAFELVVAQAGIRGNQVRELFIASDIHLDGMVDIIELREVLRSIESGELAAACLHPGGRNSGRILPFSLDEWVPGNMMITSYAGMTATSHMRRSEAALMNKDINHSAINAFSIFRRVSIRCCGSVRAAVLQLLSLVEADKRLDLQTFHRLLCTNPIVATPPLFSLNNSSTAYGSQYNQRNNKEGLITKTFNGLGSTFGNLGLAMGSSASGGAGATGRAIGLDEEMTGEVVKCLFDAIDSGFNSSDNNGEMLIGSVSPFIGSHSSKKGWVTIRQVGQKLGIVTSTGELSDMLDWFRRRCVRFYGGVMNSFVAMIIHDMMANEGIIDYTNNQYQDDIGSGTFFNDGLRMRRNSLITNTMSQSMYTFNGSGSPVSLKQLFDPHLFDKIRNNVIDDPSAYAVTFHAFKRVSASVGLGVMARAQLDPNSGLTPIGSAESGDAFGSQLLELFSVLDSDKDGYLRLEDLTEPLQVSEEILTSISTLRHILLERFATISDALETLINPYNDGGLSSDLSSICRIRLWDGPLGVGMEAREPKVRCRALCSALVTLIHNNEPMYASNGALLNPSSHMLMASLRNTYNLPNAISGNNIDQYRSNLNLTSRTMDEYGGYDANSSFVETGKYTESGWNGLEDTSLEGLVSRLLSALDRDNDGFVTLSSLRKAFYSFAMETRPDRDRLIIDRELMLLANRLRNTFGSIQNAIKSIGPINVTYNIPAAPQMGIIKSKTGYNFRNVPSSFGDTQVFSEEYSRQISGNILDKVNISPGKNTPPEISDTPGKLPNLAAVEEIPDLATGSDSAINLLKGIRGKLGEPPEVTPPMPSLKPLARLNRVNGQRKVASNATFLGDGKNVNRDYNDEGDSLHTVGTVTLALPPISGSSLLRLEEFVAVASDSWGLTVSTAQSVFYQMDSNQDGRVSLTELRHILQDACIILKNPKAAFKGKHGAPVTDDDSGIVSPPSELEDSTDLPSSSDKIFKLNTHPDFIQTHLSDGSLALVRRGPLNWADKSAHYGLSTASISSGHPVDLQMQYPMGTMAVYDTLSLLEDLDAAVKSRFSSLKQAFTALSSRAPHGGRQSGLTCFELSSALQDTFSIPSHLAQALFTLIDVNGNGVATINELRGLLRNFHRQRAEKELRARVSKQTQSMISMGPTSSYSFLCPESTAILFSLLGVLGTPCSVADALLGVDSSRTIGEDDYELNNQTSTTTLAMTKTSPRLPKSVQDRKELVEQHEFYSNIGGTVSRVSGAADPAAALKSAHFASVSTKNISRMETDLDGMINATKQLIQSLNSLVAAGGFANGVLEIKTKQSKVSVSNTEELNDSTSSKEVIVKRTEIEKPSEFKELLTSSIEEERKAASLLWSASEAILLLKEESNISRLFSEMDTSGDGQVSHSEVRVAAEILDGWKKRSRSGAWDDSQRRISAMVRGSNDKRLKPGSSSMSVIPFFSLRRRMMCACSNPAIAVRKLLYSVDPSMKLSSDELRNTNKNNVEDTDDADYLNKSGISPTSKNNYDQTKNNDTRNAEVPIDKSRFSSTATLILDGLGGKINHPIPTAEMYFKPLTHQKFLAAVALAVESVSVTLPDAATHTLSEAILVFPILLQLYQLEGPHSLGIPKVQASHARSNRPFSTIPQALSPSLRSKTDDSKPLNEDWNSADTPGARLIDLELLLKASDPSAMSAFCDNLSAAGGHHGNVTMAIKFGAAPVFEKTRNVGDSIKNSLFYSKGVQTTKNAALAAAEINLQTSYVTRKEWMQIMQQLISTSDQSSYTMAAAAFTMGLVTFRLKDSNVRNASTASKKFVRNIGTNPPEPRLSLAELCEIMQMRTNGYIWGMCMRLNDLGFHPLASTNHLVNNILATVDNTSSGYQSLLKRNKSRSSNGAEFMTALQMRGLSNDVLHATRSSPGEFALSLQELLFKESPASDTVLIKHPEMPALLWQSLWSVSGGLSPMQLISSNMIIPSTTIGAEDIQTHGLGISHVMGNLGNFNSNSGSAPGSVCTLYNLAIQIELAVSQITLMATQAHYLALLLNGDQYLVTPEDIFDIAVQEARDKAMKEASEKAAHNFTEDLTSDGRKSLLVNSVIHHSLHQNFDISSQNLLEKELKNQESKSVIKSGGVSSAAVTASICESVLTACISSPYGRQIALQIDLPAAKASMFTAENIFLHVPQQQTVQQQLSMYGMNRSNLHEEKKKIIAQAIMNASSAATSRSGSTYVNSLVKRALKSLQIVVFPYSLSENPRRGAPNSKPVVSHQQTSIYFGNHAVIDWLAFRDVFIAFNSPYTLSPAVMDRARGLILSAHAGCMSTSNIPLHVEIVKKFVQATSLQPDSTSPDSQTKIMRDMLLSNAELVNGHFIPIDILVNIWPPSRDSRGRAIHADMDTIYDLLKSYLDLYTQQSFNHTGGGFVSIEAIKGITLAVCVWANRSDLLWDDSRALEMLHDAQEQESRRRAAAELRAIEQQQLSIQQTAKNDNTLSSATVGDYLSMKNGSQKKKMIIGTLFPSEECIVRSFVSVIKNILSCRYDEISKLIHGLSYKLGGTPTSEEGLPHLIPIGVLPLLIDAAGIPSHESVFKLRALAKAAALCLAMKSNRTSEEFNGSVKSGHIASSVHGGTDNGTVIIKKNSGNELKWIHGSTFEKCLKSAFDPILPLVSSKPFGKVENLVSNRFELMSQFLDSLLKSSAIQHNAALVDFPDAKTPIRNCNFWKIFREGCLLYSSNVGNHSIPHFDGSNNDLNADILNNDNDGENSGGGDLRINLELSQGERLMNSNSLAEFYSSIISSNHNSPSFRASPASMAMDNGVFNSNRQVDNEKKIHGDFKMENSRVKLLTKDEADEILKIIAVQARCGGRASGVVLNPINSGRGNSSTYNNNNQENKMSLTTDYFLSGLIQSLVTHFEMSRLKNEITNTLYALSLHHAPSHDKDLNQTNTDSKFSIFDIQAMIDAVGVRLRNSLSNADSGEGFKDNFIKEAIELSCVPPAIAREVANLSSLISRTSPAHSWSPNEFAAIVFPLMRVAMTCVGRYSVQSALGSMLNQFGTPTANNAAIEQTSIASKNVQNNDGVGGNEASPIKLNNLNLMLGNTDSDYINNYDKKNDRSSSIDMVSAEDVLRCLKSVFASGVAHLENNNVTGNDSFDSFIKSQQFSNGKHHSSDPVSSSEPVASLQIKKIHVAAIYAAVYRTSLSAAVEILFLSSRSASSMPVIAVSDVIAAIIDPHTAGNLKSGQKLNSLPISDASNMKLGQSSAFFDNDVQLQSAYSSSSSTVFNHVCEEALIILFSLQSAFFSIAFSDFSTFIFSMLSRNPTYFTSQNIGPADVVMFKTSNPMSNLPPPPNIGDGYFAQKMKSISSLSRMFQRLGTFGILEDPSLKFAILQIDDINKNPAVKKQVKPQIQVGDAPNSFWSCCFSSKSAKIVNPKLAEDPTAIAYGSHSNKNEVFRNLNPIPTCLIIGGLKMNAALLNILNFQKSETMATPHSEFPSEKRGSISLPRIHTLKDRNLANAQNVTVKNQINENHTTTADLVDPSDASISSKQWIFLRLFYCDIDISSLACRNLTSIFSIPIQFDEQTNNVYFDSVFSQVIVRLLMDAAASSVFLSGVGNLDATQMNILGAKPTSNSRILRVLRASIVSMTAKTTSGPDTPFNEVPPSPHTPQNGNAFNFNNHQAVPTLMREHQSTYNSINISKIDEKIVAEGVLPLWTLLNEACGGNAKNRRHTPVTTSLKLYSDLSTAVNSTMMELNKILAPSSSSTHKLQPTVSLFQHTNLTNSKSSTNENNVKSTTRQAPSQSAPSDINTSHLLLIPLTWIPPGCLPANVRAASEILTPGDMVCESAINLHANFLHDLSISYEATLNTKTGISSNIIHNDNLKNHAALKLDNTMKSVSENSWTKSFFLSSVRPDEIQMFATLVLSNPNLMLACLKLGHLQNHNTQPNNIPLSTRSPTDQKVFPNNTSSNANNSAGGFNGSNVMNSNSQSNSKSPLSPPKKDIKKNTDAAPGSQIPENCLSVTSDTVQSFRNLISRVRALVSTLPQMAREFLVSGNNEIFCVYFDVHFCGKLKTPLGGKNKEFISIAALNNFCNCLLNKVVYGSGGLSNPLQQVLSGEVRVDLRQETKKKFISRLALGRK